VFNGLTPNTVVTFYQRYAETLTHYPSPKSEGLAVYLPKANQAAPLRPAVESKTQTSVTLVSVTGAQYSRDGYSWQESTVFGGLTVGTEYTFYQRLAETPVAYASPASPGLSVTTEKYSQAAPPAPTLASKSTSSVTLNTVAGAAYSIGGSSWQSSPVFSGLSADTQYIFYQRYSATPLYNASPGSPGLTVRTDKASGSGQGTGGGDQDAGSGSGTGTGTNDTGKWSDINNDGKDDKTGQPVPWLGFDSTKGDTVPAGWDGKPGSMLKPGTLLRVNFSINSAKLVLAKKAKSSINNAWAKKSKTVKYYFAYGTLPVVKLTGKGYKIKGYKFAGWYTAAAGGMKITAKSNVTAKNTTTLFAQWTAKKYKVKFSAGGKTLSKKVTYGTKYGKLPDAKDKTGRFKFLGWYTKKNGGKKITAKSVVKITKTTTLYPHWKRR
jgi:uncharacterized repeat protein (TIGR02543 family)